MQSNQEIEPVHRVEVDLLAQRFSGVEFARLYLGSDCPQCAENYSAQFDFIHLGPPAALAFAANRAVPRETGPRGDRR